MARSSSATAALLLLLSLLAVAHCLTVAVAADHAAEPEPTAAADVVGDENGLSSSNPTLPAEAGASATEEQEVLPAEQQKHEFEFLRLPSHRRHRPCSLHRHLWWKRHHGVGVSRDAPRRFFHDHYSGHGERREAAVSHLAVLPGAEAEEAAEEVKSVAEPDPDRSLPDSDGEGELVVASSEPSSFADATDGHDGERAAAAVRAWKKEMLRRWFHFHSHHGNGMRRHRLHHVHHHDDEEEDAPEGMNMKRFHFHHHHDEEDEEKNMVRKRLRHAAEHSEDGDEEEDEQVEEIVRRFRKAIMRRRFGHGGRRFFHHKHRHGEEAEKQQADGDEQSGVMAWIKGLMNRF